jgi:hypothetical protein
MTTATRRRIPSGVAEKVMFAEVFAFLLFLSLASLLGTLRNGWAPSERYLDAARRGHTLSIYRDRSHPQRLMESLKPTMISSVFLAIPPG